MPLSKPVRDYLLRTPNGRLLLGNGLALIRMGLVDPREAIALFNLAHTEAVNTKGVAPLADRFQDSMREIRNAALYASGGRGKMVPHYNTPNLSGQTLHSVMPLMYLHHLVPSNASLRNIVDLPINHDPEDPDGFVLAWNDMTPAHRRFGPASAWGRPIIWITTDAAVSRARSAARAPGETDADMLIQSLGLGHYKVGQMAVLITLPGSVVQKAGHYRPMFADAVQHRFFMARSSRPKTRIGFWGQTAHLAKLTCLPCDGAVERVSLPVKPSQFSHGQHLEVSLLDRVTSNPFMKDEAPSHLVEGVWKRRRG